MTLSNHTSRIYMDEYDVKGTLTALCNRIEKKDKFLPYYIGAHMALNLVYTHERLNTQLDFMVAFDSQLENNAATAEEILGRRLQDALDAQEAMREERERDYEEN